MKPFNKLITLDEFTIEQTRLFPKATGGLSNLLRDIGLASKLINEKVSKAGLVDILGSQGSENVQGEEQMKLDVYADNILVRVLRNSTDCAGVASEENESYIAFDDAYSKQAKYVVLFDPLDGSSNIDVNASIGTIFSIYRRLSPVGEVVNEKDFLQSGKQLMASGYTIYGSSIMLVYATKLGVNGFTLDPSIGEFCLSHRDMKIPDKENIYSINQGNTHKYSDGIKKYLAYCMEINENKNALTHRYIGSMVADVHRTLIKGGLFLYPMDAQSGKGKLRLQYECNPLSFVIEMAGGRSSNGVQSILEIEPSELHQRVPIFIGSKTMTERMLSFIQSEI